MNVHESQKSTESSAPRDMTAGELFKEATRQERERAAICLEVIKAIHKKGPYLILPEGTIPKGRARRGPGAIQKLSPSGQHIGWYRDGQKSGLPSRDMPLQRDLAKRTAAYGRALQAAVPNWLHAAILGRRSGKARRQDSKAEQIVAAYQKLQDAGVPEHRRSGIIAKQLASSREYVRRVLRRLNGK